MIYPEFLRGEKIAKKNSEQFNRYRGYEFEYRLVGNTVYGVVCWSPNAPVSRTEVYYVAIPEDRAIGPMRDGVFKGGAPILNWYVALDLAHMFPFGGTYEELRAILDEPAA